MPDRRILSWMLSWHHRIVKVKSLDVTHRYGVASEVLAGMWLVVIAFAVWTAQLVLEVRADPHESAASPSGTLIVASVCVGIAGLSVLTWRRTRRWFLAAPYSLAVGAMTVMTC